MAKKATHPHDVEKEINKIYKKVFNEVFKNNKNLDIDKAKKRLIEFSSSKKYEEFCNKFSKELAKKNIKWQKNTWKKLFKIAKKEGIVSLKSTYTDYEKDIMKVAVKKNFKMIKSIPEKIMKVLKEKSIDELINEVALGKTDRGSFKKILEEKKVKNAELIARTETAKLQTAIQKERATNLGSVCYIRKTSNDRRVRKSHREMNNVVVFWRDDENEKPHLDNMYGNAGEFPNCRCDCSSIVLPKVQLTRNSYKVYNYKTEKIEQVSKKKLLEMIENAQEDEEIF